MIYDIVRFTNRAPRQIGWLTEKLKCSDVELRRAIAAGAKQGFTTQITGQWVYTRLAIATGPTVILGDARPGRKAIGHFTDPHWGSKHSFLKGQKRFLDLCEKRKIEVIADTGDNTDGVKALLVPEQRFAGADEQLDEGVNLLRNYGFKWASITGNHDGYSSHHLGFDFGRLTEERMRAAGVDWQHAGTCVGNAVLHGARTELWHPMGAASTTNAIRRTLNSRAEHMVQPTDLLLCGHFHHHASGYAAQEDVFYASGLTFQLKRYEFSNRISRPWDIGGGIVHFTVDRRGKAKDFSYEPIHIAQDMRQVFSFGSR